MKNKQKQKKLEIRNVTMANNWKISWSGSAKITKAEIKTNYRITIIYNNYYYY